MKKNRIVGLCLACILLIIAACTPAASPPEPTQEPTIEPTKEPTAEPVNDSDDSNNNDGLVGFMDALRAAGQSVEMAGQLDQPFFSVPGQIIVVNGQDVQVFEYSDPNSAAAEAAQISPDASSVGTSMMSWIATPHFYTKDRLIALYVGEDEVVIGALNQVLGQPIAQGQAVILPEPDESTADTIPTDMVALLDYMLPRPKLTKSIRL